MIDKKKLFIESNFFRSFSSFHVEFVDYFAQSNLIATFKLDVFRIQSNIKNMTTTTNSVTLKDVDQHKFVTAFSAFLKKTGKIEIPEWTDLVKSAKFKELAPYDVDWFYTRCAATLRHIYFRSPVGVGTITKIFGGRKSNGVRPSHYCRSSGSVARKALQALENLKLIEKVPDNRGRRLTAQGRRDIDRIAAQIVVASKKKKLLLIQQQAGINVILPQS